MKDVRINGICTPDVAESETFTVNHQGSFKLNLDRWANRMETSSSDPRVRAKSIHTQEAGLVNDSVSMELASFSETQNNKGKKGHQQGR